MNCPECEKLKKRLAKTEEALIKYADQLLKIKRILLNGNQKYEQSQRWSEQGQGLLQHRH